MCVLLWIESAGYKQEHQVQTSPTVDSFPDSRAGSYPEFDVVSIGFHNGYAGSAYVLVVEHCVCGILLHLSIMYARIIRSGLVKYD